MIREIVELVKSKGFKARTVSTSYTFNSYTSNKNLPFINDQCVSSLLNEISKWLREEYKIYVTVSVEIYTLKCGYEIFKHLGDDSEPYISEYNDDTDLWDLEFEEALTQGILEALKLIKDD